MSLLFAAFVLSLLALVWTIVALTRHIRNHDTETGGLLHLTGGSSDDPLNNPE